MKILNSVAPYRVPLLHTYDPDNPTVNYQPEGISTSGMFGLRTYKPNDSAWYCMISTPTSLKIFDILKLMDVKTYESILAKENYLVIDSSFEPFYKCIDSVYKNVVVKHNIPASQVIFL